MKLNKIELKICWNHIIFTTLQWPYFIRFGGEFLEMKLLPTFAIDRLSEVKNVNTKICNA